MATENSTSSGTTGRLQKWCTSRTVYDDDDLPVLLQASFIINSIINSILSFVTVIGNILILMSLKKNLPSARRLKSSLLQPGCV